MPDEILMADIVNIYWHIGSKSGKHTMRLFDSVPEVRASGFLKSLKWEKASINTLSITRFTYKVPFIYQLGFKNRYD